ncbi:MAG: DUF2877 domain-containing protein [Actinomycetota bacterium]|nr:DUF2877 domain-containing protein [Actinomycetota bacterium]
MTTRRPPSCRPRATTAATASLRVTRLVDGPERTARVVGGGRLDRRVLVPAGPRGEPERLVSVVTTRAVRLPNAVVVDQLPAGGGIGTTAVLGAGRLRLGHAEITISRWFDPSVIVHRPTIRPAALQALETALTSRASDPLLGADVVARFGADLTAAAGPLDVAVHGLLGAGSGSTPSGDDLLAAALVALRIVGSTRAEALAGAISDGPSTTALSAEMLRAADDGGAAPEVGGLLRAMLRPSSAGRRDAAIAQLLAIGHHSGAALAAGVLIALRAELVKSRTPRPEVAA